jgi:polyphosphate kinase 2 (PPK2 family)
MKASRMKAATNNSKMKRKDYEKELRKLQVGLCRLQDWVKYKGLRVMIVFEGRDAAGKGGTIKAITERVSPRVFGSSPCQPLPTAKRLRCSCNATSSIFLRRVKSSFLTAAGTILCRR